MLTWHASTPLPNTHTVSPPPNPLSLALSLALSLSRARARARELSLELEISRGLEFFSQKIFIEHVLSLSCRVCMHARARARACVHT